MNVSKSTSTRLKQATSSSLIVGILLFMTVFLFYTIERASIKNENRVVLTAVSKSTCNQMTEWYLDEEEDARLIAANQFFSDLVGQYLRKEVNETVVIKFMNEIKTEHLYSDVLLLDLNGKYLTSTNPGLAFEDPVFNKVLSNAIQKDTSYLLDLYRSETDRQVYTGFITVIRDVNKKPLAGLIYLLNPAGSLDKLLSDWPLPNFHGKMMLVKTDERHRLKKYDPSVNQTQTKGCWQLFESHSSRSSRFGNSFSWNQTNSMPYFNNDKSLLKNIPKTPWKLYVEINNGLNNKLLNARLRVGIIIAFILTAVCFWGLFLVMGAKQKKYIDFLLTMEGELKEYKNRFMLTMDTIEEGVVLLNAEGLITYMNLEAEAVTGWKLKEVAGKKSDEIIRLTNGITGTPVNLIDHWLSGSPAMTNLNNIMLTNRIGMTVYLSCSVTSLVSAALERSGLILTFHNETEKHRQQALLQKSERRYHSLFMDAPDAFLVLNESGIISLANVHAISLFGYSSEELAGLSMEALVPEPIEKKMAFLNAFFKNPKTVSIDPAEKLFIRKKNGQTIPVLLSLSPILDGENMMVMAIFREV